MVQAQVSARALDGLLASLEMPGDPRAMGGGQWAWEVALEMLGFKWPLSLGKKNFTLGLGLTPKCTYKKVIKSVDLGAF